MSAVLIVLYGIVAYLFFLATFLYAIGFAGNLVVPKSIDSGASAPLAEALIVNLPLLALFAVQHSAMARPAFKRWWTRIVPEPIERSTYVLAATLALALLLWQWRPIADPVIWTVENRAGAMVLHVMFWLGWTVLLTSTFLINHFELFGLRQVFARLLRSHHAGTGIQNAFFLSPRAPPHLRRISARLLGDAAHDGGPSSLFRGDHRLHFDRYLL